MLKTYHSIQAHNRSVLLLGIDYLLVISYIFLFFFRYNILFCYICEKFIQRYNLKIKDTDQTWLDVLFVQVLLLPFCFSCTFIHSRVSSGNIMFFYDFVT